MTKIYFLIKIFSWYIFTAVLGLVIPKDKDLTIFVSSKGKYYNGNSRAVFEYMLSKNTKVHFFVSRKELYKELLDRKIENVIYHYSIKGLITFSRARTVCITHGYADLLGYMPSPFQNWIYLAHGIGTKSMGLLNVKLSLLDKFWIRVNRSFYVTTTSDFTRYLYIAETLIKPNRVFVTGFPRNDMLYAKKGSTKKKLKNIFYAPTYRKGEITKLFPFSDLKKELICDDLKKWDLDLHLRFHPNNYLESKNEVIDILHYCERVIDTCPDKVGDIQEILPDVDVLVTDFSSVSRDFLFLDRPMIFIMNGLEELGSHVLPIRKEFAFCGYQVYTYKEFQDAINEILAGKDVYAEVRRFARDLQYSYIDNKSSERVANLIKKLA